MFHVEHVSSRRALTGVRSGVRQGSVGVILEAETTHVPRGTFFREFSTDRPAITLNLEKVACSGNPRISEHFPAATARRPGRSPQAHTTSAQANSFALTAPCRYSETSS